MSVSGQLFDGKTSAARAARLSVDGQGQVSVSWDDGNARFQWEALSISSRLGNTPRHISLPDGSRFETDDNDGVDALLHSREADHPSLWLHRLESRMRYVVLGLVVTVLFVWGMVQYGLPAAARVVAQKLPVAVSTGISDQVLSQLDDTFFAASTLPEPTRENLQQRFAEVVAPVEQNYPFQLLFRQGGKHLGANAFALPSGMILMTDELVKLAESDDELVAIMAHEVGHVVHRHGLRQVLQHSALMLIITYMTGDVSSLVGALPVMLMQLGYSRDFEREADQYALAYLHRAGIETSHFAHIMQRLEAEHGDGGEGDALRNYLSTHPATSERIQPFLEQ